MAKENVINLGSMLKDAEQKARIRDYQNSKVLTDVEMEQANELQAKANARGMKLVPEKKVKNNARFVQIIQQNWAFLLETDYLKTEEIKFLMRLVPYIGFKSNCIVEDINKKAEAVPMTQVDLAVKLKSSKQTVGRLVNQLIDKGIMAKAESGRDDVKARMYALYVNPNIIISGDKDHVNETLQTMFRKANRKLKNLPEKLF